MEPLGQHLFASPEPRSRACSMSPPSMPKRQRKGSLTTYEEVVIAPIVEAQVSELVLLVTLLGKRVVHSSRHTRRNSAAGAFVDLIFAFLGDVVVSQDKSFHAVRTLARGEVEWTLVPEEESDFAGLALPASLSMETCDSLCGVGDLGLAHSMWP